MYLQQLKKDSGLINNEKERKGWLETIYENLLWLSGKPFPNIPHLRGNLFTGRLPHFQEEDAILHTLLAAKPLVENHSSKMCSFWLGNKRILIITKPEDIYNFKIKQKELISSKVESFDYLHGETHSILTEEGKIWRKKREAYSSHLNSNNTNSDVESIVRGYIAYIKANHKSEINLKKLFDAFSLKINANLLMGLPATSPNEAIGIEDYKRNLTETMLTATSLFGIQESGGKSAENLERHFQNIIKRFPLLNSNNLINTIGKINVDSEEDVGPKDIMADFNLLLLAGTETNSFVLQTVLYLLATHPEIEKKLRKELSEKLKDTIPSLSNISQLSYLDSIIKEVLRLYPPAPFILPRQVKETLHIGGVTLEKGDTVFISPYLTHRLPDVWENPDKFDPERFGPEKEIPKGAYIPFGLGSRACPGQRYAAQLIKFFTASIYLNYCVSLVEEPADISMHNSSAFFYKSPSVAQFIPDREIDEPVKKLNL
ncbi:cytochrome P450 [Rickettsiella endosymbiont of Dermanyssus gallinae]|uniref:cytochrome P450 n=1 Tax=Rickettsiella endosymbiont of Dermanyssus gallinae TaxID=2856608 RepID=UPI001C52B309|nr:cytochrome P450 [Rickettsiella endosymbiont of Dermanyssus gallinae]